MSQKAAPQPTLTIARVFDATPERLWTFWTDPKKFAKWFNPAPGHDLVIHEYDVRPGGRVRFDMPQPDGNPNPQAGVFHVVEPHRELVSGEADGSFLVRVLFEPVGARTRMTVEVTGLPAEWHAPATQGWNAGFDKLVRQLEGSTAVSAAGSAADEPAGFTIERILPAPPEKVWAMWTTREGLMKWWALSARDMGYAFTVKELDVRPGGKYAFEMKSKEHTLVNGGTYATVLPHRELSMAWHFDIFLGPGERPYDVPIRVTLEPVADGTKMTFTQGPLATPEHTDGSRQGVEANFERLAQALAA